MDVTSAGPQTRIEFVDLMSGIGGMHLGVTRAGGHCAMACEIDRFARQTYQANFPDTEVAPDIFKLEGYELPERVDMLCAGIACQPYSKSGVSKRRSLNRAIGGADPMGRVYQEVVRLTVERPDIRAVFLENVPHMRTFREFDRMLDAFRGAGFEMAHTELSSRPYVPQDRRRLLIYGVRPGVQLQRVAPFIPAGDMFGSITVRDILEPEVSPKYTLTDRMWDYLQAYREKHRKAGNGFGFGLVDLESHTRVLSARYYKDGSEILIPQEGKNPRRLTPRECARLMGFPDSYRIVVSDTQAYKQFGNAVVPAVVAHVANYLIEVLAA